MNKTCKINFELILSMYLELIDTVMGIVKTYGVGILSKPPFWNIVSDSYRFSSDYSLRNTYKMCLDKGYVAEILALKGEPSKTISKIKDIIRNLKNQPFKEDELTAVLFSIAIAVGSCSRSDYEEFPTKLNSANHPCQNDNIHQNPQHTHKVPKRMRAKYRELLLGGLISVGIGTLSYGLYLFHGWWMLFVLILGGFIQLMSATGFPQTIGLTKNETVHSDIASIGLPFFIVFIANSMLSIFFMNYDFRWKVYEYWKDWQPANFNDLAVFGQEFGWDRIHDFPDYLKDSPSILSFLMGIFLIVLFGSCCYEMFSKVSSGPKINIKYFLLSLSLIVVVEGGIFTYPLIKKRVQEERFLDRKKNVSELMMLNNSSRGVEPISIES